MAWSAAQIERVVRQVLADLGIQTPGTLTPGDTSGATAGLSSSAEQPGQPGFEVSPSESPPGPNALTPNPSPASGRGEDSQNGELVVARRVVTLREVEGRLDGMRCVVVPAGAVVTPAVRDELLRRGVALTFRALDQPKQAGLRLVMMVVSRRFDASPLSAALQRRGVTVECERLECLVAATDRLAEELARPDTLGLLLSRHTAVALCLANRHGTIRAVLGREPAELDADVAAVGANLLVVDPYGAGMSVLSRLVQEFCAGGVKQCPEALRARLG